jgi:hypothetical protein
MCCRSASGAARHVGTSATAKGDIRLLQETQPGATIGKVKDHFPYLSNLAQVLDGLRKAGFRNSLGQS